MKKLFLEVSAIAGMMVCSVSMSSCTQDEIDGSVREPVSKDQVAMSLFGNSGEDGSRTQLGENNNVFFCKGDSISVFNNADTNENAPFVANKDEDFPGTDPDTARAATFNGEANIGAQYFAILYPYQKDATATSVGGDTAAITATIPDVQKAKEGNFDPHASVSVGLAQAHEWDVPKFYLRNVGGLLKFTAGGTGYNKIEITGAKNENIAGKVSITVSGAVPTITDKSAGVKKITLTDVEPGKIYYVGILPQTFDEGITMDFFNGSSKVGTKKIFNGTAGPTVNRSRVCNVGKVTPEKKLIPSGTVDLDLPSGLLWAYKNIGADSPEKYGWYFGWGATEPLLKTEGTDVWTGDGKTESVTVDGKYWKTGRSDGYTESNTPYYNSGSGTSATYSKYTDSSSAILESGDDAATVNLGSDWRMPTSTEYQELYDNCYWVWCNGSNIKYKGTDVKGYIVYKSVDMSKDKGRSTSATGPSGHAYNTDNDTHIFLPASGYIYGTEFYHGGEFGNYWSSSPYTDKPYNAYDLGFKSVGVYPQSSSGRRYHGFTVRPVHKT